MRDATIGWILKQIEKAETAQQDDAEEGAAVDSVEPVSAEPPKGVATEVMESLAMKTDAGL